jgi:protein TonB
MSLASAPGPTRPAFQLAAGLALALHLAAGLALWIAPHTRTVSPGTGAPAWTVVASKPAAMTARADMVTPGLLPAPANTARVADHTPRPDAADTPVDAWPVEVSDPAREPENEHLERPAQAVEAGAEAAPAAAEVPYYPRPELDVGPAPQGPILIDFPRGVNEEPGGARHVGRLSLFIDEAGTVRQVAIVPTDPPLPPAMQDAARNAFLQARFAPGQRQGAIVRSRIDIEVTFDDRPLGSMEADAAKTSPKASTLPPPTSGA